MKLKTLGFLSQIKLRFISKSANAKAAALKSVAPRKQQLMRTKKMQELLKSKSNANANNLNQRTSLINALFEKEKIIEVEENFQKKVDSESSESELNQRVLISKTWSRWCMLERHKQSTLEKEFMQSKLEALDLLKRIDLDLYNLAERPVIAIPPFHRRPPTLTPPDPNNFPLRMKIQLSD